MKQIDQRMRDAIDPVFKDFGAAMYICQSFESSLCMLLALMSEHKVPESFKASWDFHSEKTLGGLVKALKAQIEIPAGLEKYLGEGVCLRNKIVHGYLTENAMRLYEPKGRLDLIKDIEAKKMEIKRRDVVVNKLINALLKKYDLSVKDLKDNAEVYWQAINFEGNKGRHIEVSYVFEPTNSRCARARG